MHRRHFLHDALLSIYALPALAGAQSAATPGSTRASATRMALAAGVFVRALTAANARRALLAIDAPERTRWRYTPGNRAGLRLGEMNTAERAAVQDLLTAALSAAGREKVTNIIELELVLRELQGDFRDPDRYTVALFGTPGAALWSWRFEGHHLSLNFTLAGDSVALDAPSFLGATPAIVASGPKRGLRVLKEEEDRAWDLLNALDAPQRGQAVIDSRLYGDIVSGTPARLDPLKPEGLRADRMTPAQRALLQQLIGVFAGTFSAELRDARLARALAGAADTLYFAWAGATQRGGRFYYRIQGAQFLIEFDASQDGGNHLHSVWRDFEQDFGAHLAGTGRTSSTIQSVPPASFGRDLLRDHYAMFNGAGKRAAHRH